MGRWFPAWKARCTITMSPAAPGNGRRLSKPGRRPAIWNLAPSFSRNSNRGFIAAISAGPISPASRRSSGGSSSTSKRRGRSAERQNRPRRHPRHRIHHPVSATAQRRRSAATSHRQHAGSHRQVGNRRLPDAPGTLDSGRELRLPAQDRASVANHVRFANASAAHVQARVAALGHSHGLRRRAAGQRARKPSRPITSRKPSSTARFSITCCTTPLATKTQPEPEVDLVLDPDPRAAADCRGAGALSVPRRAKAPTRI